MTNQSTDTAESIAADVALRFALGRFRHDNPQISLSGDDALLDESNNCCSGNDPSWQQSTHRSKVSPEQMYQATIR